MQFKDHYNTNNQIFIKDFLKIQTVTAESIQEYYSELNSGEIIQYVQINATVLNEIYAKNVTKIDLVFLDLILKFLS